VTPDDEPAASPASAGRRADVTSTAVTSTAVAEAVRRAAAEDHPGVVTLIQDLVRVPSRGGIDDDEPVLDLIAGWLSARDLSARQLHDHAGRLVGIACDVTGARPGPHYVLDACADTAPFGDENAWRHPPTSATIEDGWLYGRGAADSKAAIAVFAHLAARLHTQTRHLHGTLTTLFDADEHTGNFGGAKAYFAEPVGSPQVAGVMIGYPGPDQVVAGGRGFLRARLTCHTRSGHTGGVRTHPAHNAVVKAARLVTVLAAHAQPGPIDPALGLPPRLTVTAVQGGQGYSVIPDRCEIDVDVRLTTSYPRADAQDLLERTAATVDEQHPTGRPTTITYRDSWPAYHLPDTSPLRAALLDAAHRHLTPPPPPQVAGPSNIGNYLAGLGIEATAGLGVNYRGLHAIDERIDLASIPPIQATYHHAVLMLLGASSLGLRRGSS
jgi:succinyl-diaminopimelate desuccinylase